MTQKKGATPTGNPALEAQHLYLARPVGLQGPRGPQQGLRSMRGEHPSLLTLPPSAGPPVKCEQTPPDRVLLGLKETETLKALCKG